MIYLPNPKKKKQSFNQYLPASTQNLNINSKYNMKSGNLLNFSTKYQNNVKPFPILANKSQQNIRSKIIHDENSMNLANMTRQQSINENISKKQYNYQFNQKVQNSIKIQQTPLFEQLDQKCSVVNTINLKKKIKKVNTKPEYNFNRQKIKFYKKSYVKDNQKDLTSQNNKPTKKICYTCQQFLVYKDEQVFSNFKDQQLFQQLVTQRLDNDYDTDSEQLEMFTQKVQKIFTEAVNSHTDKQQQCNFQSVLKIEF